MWWNGGFHRVADPFRHFGDGVASVPNPVGTPLDKVLVGLFRLRSLLKSPEQIFAGAETSTLARLQARAPSSFCSAGCLKGPADATPCQCIQTSCMQGLHAPQECKEHKLLRQYLDTTLAPTVNVGDVCLLCYRHDGQAMQLIASQAALQRRRFQEAPATPPSFIAVFLPEVLSVQLLMPRRRASRPR